MATGLVDRGRTGLTPATVRRPYVDLEVVIPARDEEQRLPRTLSATLAYLADAPCTAAVIVVDNGSRDATVEVALAHAGGPVPVHVVTCNTPGKGAAIRRGFGTGSSRWVGFTDADLATPVETLDRVLPLLRAGSTAVIASRRAPGATLTVSQTPLRRLGGAAFRAAASGLLPGISDSQCGFKFFRGEVVRETAAACRVDGFSFDVELLARLQRAGHPIIELGVSWSDVEGSTFDPVSHGLQSFGDTVRIRRLLAAERRFRRPVPTLLQMGAGDAVPVL